MSNSRQHINELILNKLIEANKTMSDQRFTQLLVNCGISIRNESNYIPTNEILYFEESSVTLARLERAIGDINGQNNKSS